jgi:PPOX class probable F420-dependent enzyme
MVSKNTHNHCPAANPPRPNIFDQGRRHAERSRSSGGAKHLPPHNSRGRARLEIARPANCDTQAAKLFNYPNTKFLPAASIYNVLSSNDRKEAFMPEAIPEKYRDLFQKRAFASLGTLMPDGRPQVTPVWVDYDGEHVIFNSAKGRQKDRNVRRDPRVSLALIDPENPYRYLEIRGSVVEITEDGADTHIDKMAKKYLGVDKYPYGQPGEVRVLYKIKPEHTQVMG